MKFTVCSLLVSAGCQTPASLSNWSRHDELRNAAATNQLSERIENDSPGLQSKAAELQPRKSVDELVRLGQSEVSDWYRDKSPQRLRAARGHFESALALAPQSSSAHHGIAIIADLEGNFGEAERHYQQALIQKPNDSDILGDMGYSYLLQNRFSESEQYSLRAVQANANNVNAVKHLGDAYARQGKTQLAQETYAKVYSPEEVQKALADHQPVSSPFSIQADKTNSSIFDRLIPGKTPAEKLAADIERRQQEYNQQLQRQPAAPPRPATAQQGLVPERMAQEEILKKQLQEIDRQEMARYQEGPILVDERTGQLTRLPGAENSGYGMNGNTTAANFESMSLQAPHPAHPASLAQGYAEINRDDAGIRPQASYPQTQMAGSIPPGQSSMPSPGSSGAMMTANGGMPAHGESPYYFSSAAQQQFPSQQPGLMDPGFPPQSATMLPGLAPDASLQQRRMEAGLQSSNVSGNPVRPWTGIQQANAVSADRNPQLPGEMQSGAAGPSIIQANGQVNVPQSPGQFQQGPFTGGNPSQQLPLGGGQGQIPGMGPAARQGSMGDFAAMNAGVPSQNPNLNGNAMARGPATSQENLPTPPGNAFQQASRTAARMGMGLGPGGIFPVSDASQTLQPPGSMNYENTNTPVPQRWMPDAVTPPNLSEAFQPIPNQVQAPHATTGPTPPVTYPSYSREQFGTASRYDTRTMQTSGVPLDYNNSMQGYETQRWIAGREANIAVQNIWNQGPTNSPVSASAGSQYTHPNSQGMMYTPNALGPDGRTLIPEQWPYAAVARQAPPDQPQQNDVYAQQRARFMNGQPSPAPQGQFAQDQYGSQGASESSSHQNPGGGHSRVSANQTGSRGNPSGSHSPANVIVPSDYRNYLRQNAPAGNGAGDPSAGNDSSNWPTIIPASR